jgi:tetratricopeptide (TPR) repeat protein
MRQQQPGETPSARDPRNPLNDGRPGVDPRRPDRRPEFDAEDEANFPPRPGSLGPRNTPDQIRRAADEAERMRRDDLRPDLRDTVEDRLRENIPDETREAIQDAREAARDVTEDASETAQEIREDAREAIRDRRPALGYRPDRYTPESRYYPGDGLRRGAPERVERASTLRELLARQANAVLNDSATTVNTPRRADWYRWQEYDRRHDDWLHGYWNDQRLQSRWTVYNRYPVARRVGLTFWGANALSYQFGYHNYRNPFYQQPIALTGGTTINYSRPLVVYQTSNATQDVSDRLPDAAQAQFDRARQAFAGRDYQAALVFINGALALAPDDSTLHEVRALVLFALGNYQEAAAPLYAVLSVRPGWDWATMRSFYATVPDYTQHLRELEVHQAENPSSAAASFVLAYHYLTMGHDQAAADQYRNVIANNEDDYLSRSLLDSIVGNEPVGPPPGERVRRDIRIQAEDLQGVWMAEGRSESQYRLALGPDQTFQWTYTDGSQTRTIEGVYALEGDTLAMEPDTGGVLLAEVSSPQNGSFDFRMIGAPTTANDSALRFTIRR